MPDMQTKNTNACYFTLIKKRQGMFLYTQKISYRIATLLRLHSEYHESIYHKLP